MDNYIPKINLTITPIIRCACCVKDSVAELEDKDIKKKDSSECQKSLKSTKFESKNQ